MIAEELHCKTKLMTSLVYSCNPWVIGDVMKDIKQYLSEKSELRARVENNTDTISVYAETSAARKVGRFINSRIHHHQAKITSTVEVKEALYLPILANQQLPLKTQMEVKVLSSDGTHVPLEQLTRAYFKACVENKGKPVKTHQLAQYIEPGKYQWYWMNKSTLKPYSASVSQKLEEAFCEAGTIIESIGQIVYEISTSDMHQTNTETKKVRKIKRKLEQNPTVSFRIRTLSEDLRDTFLAKLDKCIHEIEEEVLYAEEYPGILEHLVELARERFVGADIAPAPINLPERGDLLLEKTLQTLTPPSRWLHLPQAAPQAPCTPQTNEGLVSGAPKQASAIILKGMFSVILSMQLQLKDEVLRRMRGVMIEKSSFSSADTPDHWEPQESMCDLKVVSKGSAEWDKVWGHITGNSFRPNDVCIERIQNPWLWRAYSASLKRVLDKNNGEVNEKWLFHGSGGVPPVKIYNSEQGFDNRFAIRGMWGKGAYFAVKAEYSNSYAYTTPKGNKQMFLAQVVTGITYKCPPSQKPKRLPPKKANYPVNSSGKFEDERYDSVSGNTGDSDIFVIYDLYKAYPAYLITYNGI
jgi:hypothetical protein